ncbi:hypothetical protein DM82_708 [Burkholderia oklahomensis]|uniref:Uncharacterized protein n=1 Tax=Burkholderia oklahomensis TaxID=342113 RepID=A0AAI8B3M6_9BURK|nr:hypothetical protein DM82_708 [Burkholderia oklahomensis]
MQSLELDVRHSTFNVGNSKRQAASDARCPACRPHLERADDNDRPGSARRPARLGRRTAPQMLLCARLRRWTAVKRDTRCSACERNRGSRERRGMATRKPPRAPWPHLHPSRASHSDRASGHRADISPMSRGHRMDKCTRRTAAPLMYPFAHPCPRGIRKRDGVRSARRLRRAYCSSPSDEEKSKSTQNTFSVVPRWIATAAV